MPASPPFSALENGTTYLGVPGHHLATQGSSSALQVAKTPLMPSRSTQNYRSTGGISKCELFLVNAGAHDDTNLRLSLPCSFYQTTTLATRVGGLRSNQQPWELVFRSTGGNWHILLGRRGHVFEAWANWLEDAIASPVLEMLLECHSGTEVTPSQCQRQ